jgi:preprotein translocase subunit SecY
MTNLSKKLQMVFTSPAILKKILFILLGLVAFRALATIPIPGVNALALESFLAQSGNEFFGLLNIFSGGGLSNLSIVMLGVGPYITASIIMQLLTMIFPKLKATYQEEGEAGRLRFSQWTRFISVPLAIIQAYGFLALLRTQGGGQILGDLTMYQTLLNVLIITAGSVALMWIGEVISEFGLGNGTSFIIFAGIVSALPTTVNTLLLNYDPSQIPLFLIFGAVALIATFGVVMVNEAERPIQVTYSKQMRGGKVFGGVSSYLPLRLNQAGVIPIIFALSLLLFPQLFLSLVATTTHPGLLAVSNFIKTALNPQGYIYAALYFVLVFLFTYFYTAVTFDPKAIAENLQKNGAFIPGVRPGTSTEEYLGGVVTRITLVGALFLGLIAVLPLLIRDSQSFSVVIGGTSLLIVVSVVLDILKKLDAQLSMMEY